MGLEMVREVGIQLGTGINPDALRFAIFAGGFVCFFVLESLFAKRDRALPRWRRAGFHIAIAVFNTVLVRTLTMAPFLAFAAFVESKGLGLARQLPLHGWQEILASIVVLDALNYWWHRLNHRVPFLWRFHKAHHSDTEMDVSTVLRFHPGELLISVAVKAVWILLWGPSAAAWFLFEVLVSLSAQFHHSNIDFPDRVEHTLTQVLVTPRFHAAHHAVDRAFGDQNFSTILNIWDRIFGSFARPADGGQTTLAPGSIGLTEGRDAAFSFGAWLLEPVDGRNGRGVGGAAEQR